MKTYTDLEQSKKLAEILPLESADMTLVIDLGGEHLIGIPYIKEHEDLEELRKQFGEIKSQEFPCWSLAALLDVLSYPQLSKDKLGSGKIGWMISVYPNDCRYDSCWYDNPIDACYEMIVKLKEQNLL